MPDGRRGTVAAGHHLAADAAAEILAAGGNAVDAGVGGGLALAVVQSDYVNLGGVAPIMIRRPDGRAFAIDGVGPWPAATDADVFRRDHGGTVPKGILRSVVPAAPAAWIRALDLAGTMTFADVAAPAIRFARKGFSMHRLMRDNIAKNEDGYRRWPENARIYLPGGRLPNLGQAFVQTDLADTLDAMADACRAAHRGGRRARLAAARAVFYEGPVAEAIARYHVAEGGWLTRADLASYDVEVRDVVRARFAGGTVLCCPAWCQGPFLGQLLRLLDRLDWSEVVPLSVPWLHRVVECTKLAFADREACLGDPRHTDVPVARLLSDAHLRECLGSLEESRAMPGLPPSRLGPHIPEATASRDPAPGDTSSLAVVDADGLAFSATPSDVSYASPIIPGTGLCASPRGSASWAARGHPASVEAGHRPRLTPNPAVWEGPDGTVMPFGTPGGDMQVQAMAQFMLCHVVGRLPLQAAAEAPRVGSYSAPSSFAPHKAEPGLVRAELMLPREVRDGLAALGHRVEDWPERSPQAGAICAVACGPDGRRAAASDPRRPTGMAEA